MKHVLDCTHVLYLYVHCCIALYLMIMNYRCSMFIRGWFVCHWICWITQYWLYIVPRQLNIIVYSLMGLLCFVDSIFWMDGFDLLWHQVWYACWLCTLDIYLSAHMGYLYLLFCGWMFLRWTILMYEIQLVQKNLVHFPGYCDCLCMVTK